MEWKQQLFMVQEGRYRVHNYDSYDQICGASINNVDILYVSVGRSEDTLEIEEVNNKQGEGASNTVDRSAFESLLEGGYVEKT